MDNLTNAEIAAEAHDAEIERQEFNDPREQDRLQHEADLRFEYSREEYDDYEGGRDED